MKSTLAVALMMTAIGGCDIHQSRHVVIVKINAGVGDDSQSSPNEISEFRSYDLGRVGEYTPPPGPAILEQVSRVCEADGALTRDQVQLTETKRIHGQTGRGLFTSTNFTFRCPVKGKDTK